MECAAGEQLSGDRFDTNGQCVIRCGTSNVFKLGQGLSMTIGKAW